MLRKAVALVLAVLLLPGCAQALPIEPEGNFHLFLAGGYPFAIGVTHQWTSGQYSISGGFTYKQPDWPIGLQFDGMNHHFGFNSRAEDFTKSEGYMQITAGTANATWTSQRRSDSRLKPRLIGGVGVYNRVLRTTETHLVAGTCFDPWWGYVPCAGNATLITNSHSQTKFGVNAGTALGYLFESGVEVFLQLRWHLIFTSKKETMFMPLELGLKF